MAKRCPIMGKNIQTGNNVPFNRSNTGVRTRRRFVPNLQNVSLLSETLGSVVKMRVSVQGLRTIEHNGGLDAYLLGTSNTRLTDEAKALKTRIEKAKAKKAA